MYVCVCVCVCSSRIGEAKLYKNLHTSASTKAQELNHSASVYRSHQVEGGNAHYTMSTTEAELLALSQAACEGIYIQQLLRELKINLDSKNMIIQCDNQQTLCLMTE